MKKGNQFKVLLPVLFLMCSVLSGCHFLQGVTESTQTEINGITLKKSSTTIKVAGMDYIQVIVNPSSAQQKVNMTWSYDTSIIQCDTSSKYGVTITGVSEGVTPLRCSCNGYDAVCMVTVSGYAQNYERTIKPYIYSNYNGGNNIIQMKPDKTETVSVSLYNGDNTNPQYTWTSEDANVASVQATGARAVITSKKTGYTRIKVSHAEADYPYYFGVYVFDDPENVTYLTTSDNIIQMEQDSPTKTISIGLVNPKTQGYENPNNWTWEVITDNGTESPVDVIGNGNKATITPKPSVSGGICTIRVKHEEADYPLDIICNVITYIKNVYIEPSTLVTTVSGEQEQIVTFNLKNITAGEYSVDEYTYSLDNYDVAKILASVGNQVVLGGVANGSCKLIVHHPKAPYNREVLVIVNGQIKDAIDASCYITTSDNYVRTKVGAEPITINVSLKGGEDGDETKLQWHVKSEAVDGVSDVIKLETTNGTVTQSRSAAMSYAFGKAIITPLAEGTATITVTHPKIYYPTEILVKVLSADAVLEDPLYFTGSGIIKIINGEEADYTVELKGKNKNAFDDTYVTWEAEDSRLTLTPTANQVHIATTPSAGQTISHITARHPKCDADKKILVLTADTQQELDSMRALYSDKLHYNMQVGDTATLTAESVGFDTIFKRYDFSSATWTCSNPNVVEITKDTNYPLNCTVKALKSGSSKVTVRADDKECVFSILVYPEGAYSVDPEVYFTTSNNVVSIKTGTSQKVNVSAINLSQSEYGNITWTVEDSGIASVTPNGTSATITGLKDGETIVYVTHEQSQNTLKLYIRVGSEYVIPDADPTVYIEMSHDVVPLLRDDPITEITAYLRNYNGTTPSDFGFSIDNSDIADITGYANGKCFVKAKSSGQALITVSHPDAITTTQVIILVGNSAEELASFKYLTTSQNVVSIGEGRTQKVSVNIKNATEVAVDGYTWTSSDSSVVSVNDVGSSTCVLTGNKIGTAIITVRHTGCKYPLKIYANCVDPIAAAANPFIQLDKNIMTLVYDPYGSNAFQTIRATLVGGTDEDVTGFNWESADSSVCMAYTNNGEGRIRAVKEGTTYIRVTHPKARVEQQLLVVVDKKLTTNCSIKIDSDSIISIKPTDGQQKIRATLTGDGVSENDNLNFTWSIDVSGVVDFTYNENLCTIKPIQTGSCNIVIHHPKAQYDKTITVTVQEYNTFNFPLDTERIVQDDIKIINMEIPYTNTKCHVEYTINNPAVCNLEGSSNKVCIIRGVGKGTTQITAKLIADNNGAVLGTAQTLVYVDQRPSTSAYITTNKTIYTVNKGKGQTLTASLVGSGIEVNDVNSLVWTTDDTDVISLVGISSDGKVTGKEIKINAIASGTAIITITHSKVSVPLQIYIEVPGTGTKVVSLNKSYVTMLKGSAGTQIKASIENGESADYNNLYWSATDVSGQDKQIVRIMGIDESGKGGKEVTLYPMNVGEARVYCQLPDSDSVAVLDVVVQAAKSLILDYTGGTVQPAHTIEIPYTISPASDSITTIQATTSDMNFICRDKGHDVETGRGAIEITGVKEGNGQVVALTDGGAKATFNVKCDWDYRFSLDTYRIMGTPDQDYYINMTVNPADAIIKTDDYEEGISIAQYNVKNNNDGTALLTIHPVKEGSETVSVCAYNKLPDGTLTLFKQYSVNLVLHYTHITPLIEIKSSTGVFSRYDPYSSTLYLGDGEEVTMTINVANKTASGQSIDWELTNLNITKLLTSSTNTFEIHTAQGAKNRFTLRNPTDVIKYEYYIPTFYVPTYSAPYVSLPTDDAIRKSWGNGDIDPHQFRWYGNKRTIFGIAVPGGLVCTKDCGYSITYSQYETEYYPSGYTLSDGSISYYKTEEKTHVETHDESSFGINGNNFPNGFGKRHDASRDGTVLTQEEYESTPWYYRPYLERVDGWFWTYAGPYSAAQTGNQPAIKRMCDSTVISSSQTEKITFHIKHDGIDESFTIKVVTETRPCDKQNSQATLEQEIATDEENVYKGQHLTYPFTERYELPDNFYDNIKKLTLIKEESKDVPVEELVEDDFIFYGAGWYVFTAVGSKVNNNDTYDFVFAYLDETGNGYETGMLTENGQYNSFDEAADLADLKNLDIPFKYWCYVDRNEEALLKQQYTDFALPDVEVPEPTD